MNEDTWIVMPVYNEATVVGDVVRGVNARFAKVVCVEDGSDDDTLRQLSLTNAHVVRHPLNLGQGAALQTGIEYALQDPEARYFVTFDSDGQHRVSDAEAMLERLRRDELDVILGSRFMRDAVEVGFLRKVILKAAVAFTNATTKGVHVTDTHNGLRAFNRKFAESVRITMPDMSHASEVIARIGEGHFRYTEFPVTIDYTDYSMHKGQSLLNSVNILFDLVFASLRRGK